MCWKFDPGELKRELEALAAGGETAAAERRGERELSLVRERFGPEHPSVAILLHIMGEIYMTAGKPGKAAEAQERALEIFDSAFGPGHPDTAEALAGLALAGLALGEFDRAGAAADRAGRILREAGEFERCCAVLGEAAFGFFAAGKHGEAERFYITALRAGKKAHGPGHPGPPGALNALAIINRDRAEFSRAEHYYHRQLRALEQMYGPGSPETAPVLNAMASLCRTRNEYVRAERLYRRALEILAGRFGEGHPHAGMVKLGLGMLFREQGDRRRAEEFYRGAAAALENSGDGSALAAALSGHADLCRLAGRPDEAAALEERAGRARKGAR